MIMSIINDLLCNNNSKGTMCVYVFFFSDLQQDLWQLKISYFGAANLSWYLFGFSPEGGTTHVWLSLSATDVEYVCFAGPSAAYLWSIVIVINSSNNIAAIVNSIADASLIELVELISVVVFVSLAFDPTWYILANFSWLWSEYDGCRII